MLALAAGPSAPAPAGAQVAAPAPAKPSLEFIFSDDGRAITTLPSWAWLDDGSALYWDTRTPAAARTIERLDPATGARQPVVDARKALAQLNAIAPGAYLDEGLPWPEAFDRQGRRAFYLFDGDVFVLDCAASTFTRLTSTGSAERNLTVSPDGTRVAFVRDHDLYSLDLSSGAEHRLTTDGSPTVLNGTLSWVYWEEIFGRKDTAYWWSPDGSAIAFLRSDEGPVPVSHFVDFEPATPRVLEQRYPKPGDPNPVVRVGIVSAGGGGTRWVTIDDKPYEYVLRVVWLPDSKRLSVQTLTRDQQELGLYFADAANGRASRILTETDPGWVNITDDLRFLKDGQHFLWASERDGYMHLYRYTMGGRLVNKVTNGPWALASADESAYWVRRAVAGVDEAEGWVYFVSLEAGSTERQLYRVRFDGTGLNRISSEPGAHSISMSNDARFYFDAWSDAQTPPQLAVRRGDGRPVASLAPPLMSALRGWTIQPPEITTVPARDGFRMPARILRPAGFRPGVRYPVVLYVYGGPSAPTVKNAWQENMLYDQLLVANGYVAVEVDNRAATGISKTLENTILRRSGGPETDDLLDAVRWLKAQPWVDPARVGVWGWSGGGTMTLNLMTRSREFRAGISVAPVTDWRYYDTKWAESFMKRPQDNPEGYAAFSLVRRAANLHGRLLLVWGTDDDNVHPQNEQAFVNALIEARVPVDMAIYPMRKHGISDDAARVHLFARMMDFWDRNLKGE